MDEDYQFKSFIKFARILGQQSDFEEVLRLVSQKSAQLLGADLALILMVNPDTRNTIKIIMKDDKTVLQEKYRSIHIHVGGWIINHQQAFISHHLQKDERFVNGLFNTIPDIAVVGVPLIIEGIVIGSIIMLYCDRFKSKPSNLMDSLESLAIVSAPFLHNTQKIRKYFISNLSESSLLVKYSNIGLYGKSSNFIELLHTIEAATKCDTRVLLIGETGTGKELIAKAIHKYSNRSDSPFVAVDCGAIPDELMESEFFGHTRGAFTGAHKERQGLFLQADNGTLFMDEINNLPREMQTKLLRILEENEVRPVGSDKTIKTNVRVIAASSVSFKRLVKEKLFREDLFFRLYVYPICIPSLSERREDIPLLANHFLEYYSNKQNKKLKNFHEEIIDFICNRKWYGNIRELENFVERLVILTPDDVVTLQGESFPADLREEWNMFHKSVMSKSSEPLKKQVQNFEAKLIRKTLYDCDWNQSKTARLLETSEKNIRYKIEKLQILKPEAKNQ